ncbi:hypothetical protein BN946_scf184851.g101 [Trametes cinnabarina]|uniref:MYND-type domain-containing protein n=1 Tax=Pycnoporus cinnabarinus TaxID=5643 RepID=A0A060SBE9_PYCCI|nr:hypothetical protein BN946_scf184851.g101 [Trametes cinnabarina]
MPKHRKIPSQTPRKPPSVKPPPQVTLGPRIVEEVSVNRPANLFSYGQTGFEQYLTLKEEVCYDYRSPPEFRRLYLEGQRTTKENSIRRLERGLELKDGPLMFEYCLRRLTPNARILSSCDVPPDSTLNEIPVGDILGEIAGLATYSTLVRNRGAFAKVKNTSAQLQLRALAALFRPLWQAHDEYLAALQAREARRLAKVAKAPNQYKCANDECEIQTFTKHSLKRCGGDCPPDKKPYYCSLYCQRIHWVYHREFCKNLSENTEIIDDDGDPAWVDMDDFRPKAFPDPYWDSNWSPWAEREGPEIFIDIKHPSHYRPGEIIRLRTRTLSPVCLSVYKRYWTLPEEARDILDTSLGRQPMNEGHARPQPRA